MPISVPRQPRSHATLERIVTAAHALLEERTFDEITMQQIAAAAEVAVGTLYTRFRRKEDLLPYLYRRYEDDLEQQLAESDGPAAWSSLPLEARIERTTALCVRLYRSRRGLWRAVTLHAYASPGSISAEQRARRRTLVDGFARSWLECRDRIGHPRPAVAVPFVLSMIMAACKDRIVFAEASEGITRRCSDAQLVRELHQMGVAYLAVQPGDGP